VANGYLALPALTLSRHLFEQHEKLLLEKNGPLLMAELVNRFATSYFKN